MSQPPKWSPYGKFTSQKPIALAKLSRQVVKTDGDLMSRSLTPAIDLRRSALATIPRTPSPSFVIDASDHKDPSKDLRSQLDDFLRDELHLMKGGDAAGRSRALKEAFALFIDHFPQYARFLSEVYNDYAQCVLRAEDAVRESQESKARIALIQQENVDHVLTLHKNFEAEKKKLVDRNMQIQAMLGETQVALHESEKVCEGARNDADISEQRLIQERILRKESEDSLKTYVKMYNTLKADWDVAAAEIVRFKAQVDADRDVQYRATRTLESEITHYKAKMKLLEEQVEMYRKDGGSASALIDAQARFQKQMGQMQSTQRSMQSKIDEMKRELENKKGWEPCIKWEKHSEELAKMRSEGSSSNALVTNIVQRMKQMQHMVNECERRTAGFAGATELLTRNERAILTMSVSKVLSHIMYPISEPWVPSCMKSDQPLTPVHPLPVNTFVSTVQRMMIDYHASVGSPFSSILQKEHESNPSIAHFPFAMYSSAIAYGSHPYSSMYLSLLRGEASKEIVDVQEEMIRALYWHYDEIDRSTSAKGSLSKKVLNEGLRTQCSHKSMAHVMVLRAFQAQVTKWKQLFDHSHPFYVELQAEAIEEHLDFSAKLTKHIMEACPYGNINGLKARDVISSMDNLLPTDVVNYWVSLGMGLTEPVKFKHQRPGVNEQWGGGEEGGGGGRGKRSKRGGAQGGADGNARHANFTYYDDFQNVQFDHEDIDVRTFLTRLNGSTCVRPIGSKPSTAETVLSVETEDIG